MNVIDIAAAAFAALPKVNQVWVDAKGQFHLHPNNGGVLIERNQKETIEEVIDEKPKGKKKK